MANVVGQRVRRREDPRFLTGKGTYVDDIKPPDVLHVQFVRSYMAHAKVLGIDKSAAEALPGTQVFTAADTDLTVNAPPPFIQVPPEMFRPFIASDKARFVGDIVAVVVSETREGAYDAAELVIVDYEPLPSVTDLREALRDEVLLFESAGTNTCIHVPPQDPDPELFDRCDVVVSGSIESQRLAACPVEPRSTIAEFGDDGRLTVWLSTQTPHQDKMVLGLVLGLEPEQVRVIAPDVGGGFGGKGLDVEDVILGWLARATGRPVKWTETRSENLVAMHHGRAQICDFEIGGDRDGKVQALRIKILQDAGAYPGIGAFLANLTSLMSSGVYAIGKIEAEVIALVTNSTPTGPVRGAGRPEATQMIERAMDLFAAEVSLDAAEVRRRNFIPADAFPTTTASGAHYDVGDYEGALDLALQTAGYDELRSEQARRRERGDVLQLGIGVSAYVEITNGINESEFGAVEITADGEAIVRTGSFSQGQGHETTFAQIVAERIGLPIEKITVLKGDTDAVARGTGTYGSKSTQIGGAAAGQASEVLVERAKELAANELEASPEDMVLDLERGPLPRGRSAGARSRLDRARCPARRRRPARRAERGGGLRARAADVPVRRARRGRRGRHRDGVGPPAADDRRRRRRHDHQPARRRGPGPRRSRGRDRPGAVRGAALRHGGQPAERQPRHLLHAGGAGAALVRARRDGDADPDQPARRQGDRRVGHDRRDARGPERGDRRGLAPRSAPH